MDFFVFNHGGNGGQMVHTVKFGPSSTTCQTAVVYFFPAVVQLSPPRRNRFHHPSENPILRLGGKEAAICASPSRRDFPPVIPE